VTVPNYYLRCRNGKGRGFGMIRRSDNNMNGGSNDAIFGMGNRDGVKSASKPLDTATFTTPTSCGCRLGGGAGVKSGEDRAVLHDYRETAQASRCRSNLQLTQGTWYSMIENQRGRSSPGDPDMGERLLSTSRKK